MGQLSGDKDLEMSKSWALPVWSQVVQEREFMMKCGPCGKEEKDRVLWECIGSHRGEGRPGSQ